MKTGKSLSVLAAELDRQAKTKHDYIADTRALKMEAKEGGLVLQGVNGGMLLTHSAHRQLAATLCIPAAYYDLMIQKAPDLLAANVNRWLQVPAKKLVRTLDGQIRAILSDSYRPLDNWDLTEAVLPKLAELQATVVSGEVTDRRFYLKAVTDKIRGDVNVGDTIQAGVVVSNSEIGEGALQIAMLDYRLVCLNGMIRENAFRKAHLGKSSGRGHDAIEESREFFRDETRQADDRAFFLKVQDAVASMFDQKRFEARLNQYRDAASQIIEGDPVRVVDATVKRFNLNDSEKSGILQHLIRGADLSAYGLANAVTRASQDVADYDIATSLETIGGRIVEMPAKDWKSLANGIVKEVPA